MYLFGAVQVHMIRENITKKKVTRPNRENEPFVPKSICRTLGDHQRRMATEPVDNLERLCISRPCRAVPRSSTSSCKHQPSAHIMPNMFHPRCRLLLSARSAPCSSINLHKPPQVLLPTEMKGVYASQVHTSSLCRM